MSYRTVLFDLDGTLIDHFKAIHRCHAYAMRRLGLPEPTMQQVRDAVGGGLDQAIAKLAGADKVEALMPLFVEHWDATSLDDVEALPGSLELLQALRDRGITAAVFTNKRGYAARAVCDHLGMSPLLAGVFGVGDTPWLKPDPAFARHALEKIGGEAASTVLVGDSPFDIAAARNAGLGFIGVTTGTHSAEDLRADGAARVEANLAGVQAALGLA